MLAKYSTHPSLLTQLGSSLLSGVFSSARSTGGTVLALDDLNLRRGIVAPTGDASFRLDQLTGRLVEVSAQGASAVLTAAVGIVLDAQEQGEPVAWITRTSSSFYPPDLHDSGVDLDALVVVRVPEAIAGARAAERLLRSAAFGLVVLDLGADAEFSMAHQGRLVTLAKQHDAAVLVVTEKPASKSSVGSLVSLRTEAIRQRVDGRYGLVVRALKDKRRGPGWEQREPVRTPAGMK